MVVLSRKNENALNGIILLASVARASSCYYVNCVVNNHVCLFYFSPGQVIFPIILKPFQPDNLFNVQQLIRCITTGLWAQSFG